MTETINEGKRTMTEGTTLGSDAIRALETTWAAIRERHPDVLADPVFVTGTGATRSGLTLGSVTVNTVWQQRNQAGGGRFHEVFIAAETLAQTPEKLLETLIHEAVHTIATTRGVKDTSRQYRYHNRRFRELCEEAGLEWAHQVAETVTVPGHGKQRFLLTDGDGEHRCEDGFLLFPVEAKADEKLGYSDMTITDETVAEYREVLEILNRDLQIERGYRAIASTPPKKRRTVCMVHTPGAASMEFSSVYGAVEHLGGWPAEDAVQRIGVVVYEGLKGRGLLAGHVWWLEYV